VGKVFGLACLLFLIGEMLLYWAGFYSTLEHLQSKVLPDIMAIIVLSLVFASKKPAGKNVKQEVTRRK
jgi:hypothetical protein